MPNNAADLRTVTGLLDRIPQANGGTAATPRQWVTDRTALITQVRNAIVTFQTVNRKPTIDGVVDPGGGSIRVMNQLAALGPLSASLETQDVNSQFWVAADPTSLDGTGPLRPRSLSHALTRKLIRVSGTSIKWFGVVVPVNSSGGVIGGAPHIFFTPSPGQGGYQDGTYSEFTHWRGLWDKYTSAIGSQLVASGAQQILVIPFYTNAQTGNLGAFLTNWKEAIRAVLTVAVNATDPLFLRDKFEFTEIYTSSFSNGITSHQNFNQQGAGAASMTTIAFDLDGQAAGSKWRPGRGVVYANTGAQGGANPAGNTWHVGGRFGQIRPSYPGASDHNLCPFLLLHGLSRFG
jgi:hypothetical protein